MEELVMKKLLALLLAAMMLVAFVGCGATDENKNDAAQEAELVDNS